MNFFGEVKISEVRNPETCVRHDILAKSLDQYALLSMAFQMLADTAIRIPL